MRSRSTLSIASTLLPSHWEGLGRTKFPRDSGSLQVCGKSQAGREDLEVLSTDTIESGLSVRFVDEPTIHQYDAPEHPKKLWISPETRMKSEQRSKDAGRRAILNKKALLLNGTFATKPRPETQEGLNMFVRVSEARGMERVICEEHNQERKRDRAELFRSVLDAQDLAWKNDWDPRKLRERVRDLSMRYSYRGKVFARNIAIADEAAISPLLLKDIQPPNLRRSSGSRSTRPRSSGSSSNHKPCSKRRVGGGSISYVRQQSLHDDNGGCRMFACF